METTAHFDNIQQEVSRQLGAATEEILIAVDWFADRVLFDILCQQAGRGLLVRLAVQDDKNNTAQNRVNLQRLQDIGGDVYLIPVITDDEPLMQQKFCVVDRSTVILGTQNWAAGPQSSSENITVITDATEISTDYLNAFNTLLNKYDLSTPATDSAQIRTQLEALSKLVLYEDWEAITHQLEKMRPAETELGLAPLFTILEMRDTWSAIDWIDEYLNGTSSLVLATDQEIAFLRLTLRALECQFTALSDEKAEIDRVVHEFSLRTSHEVGDLLTRYLELRAEKLRRLAAVEKNARPEANRARENYEHYRTANESSREKSPPPQLHPDDLKELKRLYREASQKCHPDKVSEADREQAGQLFVQLQTAYRGCDLEELRTIHAAVRDGHMFIDRSSAFDEADSLYNAIARLRRDLERLAEEIHDLRQTEAYHTYQSVSDWNIYFARKRIALQQAIEQLETELAEHAKEA